MIFLHENSRFYNSCSENCEDEYIRSSEKGDLTNFLAPLHQSLNSWASMNHSPVPLCRYVEIHFETVGNGWRTANERYPDAHIGRVVVSSLQMKSIPRSGHGRKSKDLPASWGESHWSSKRCYPSRSLRMFAVFLPALGVFADDVHCAPLSCSKHPSS